MADISLRALGSVAIVLALLGALAFLVKRGAFAQLRTRARSMAVETALPLGERRSLVIVEVEGRRVLLGLAPGSVSLITELGQTPFARELERHDR